MQQTVWRRHTKTGLHKPHHASDSWPSINYNNTASGQWTKRQTALIYFSRPAEIAKQKTDRRSQKVKSLVADCSRHKPIGWRRPFSDFGFFGKFCDENYDTLKVNRHWITKAAPGNALQLKNKWSHWRQMGKVLRILIAYVFTYMLLFF